MSAERGRRLALFLLILTASPLAAQRIRRELGVTLIHLEGERGSSTSLGLSGGLRAGSRGRIMAYAGVGQTSADEMVGRVEGVVHFLLAPGERSGVGLYGGGGIGVDIHDRTDAWLVATLGLEGRPGARSGWVIEGGFGGGFRAAAGWRWRWA